MGYKEVVIKGIKWIFLLRVLTRILSFAKLAILGRLLTPAEFGFFGIASLLLTFLEIFTETGINVFLIQHKGHIKEYVSSAWVVSMLRGVILTIIILLTAPLIADFFNASSSLPVIYLIAVVPFIRGFINPAIISYQKDLAFANEVKFRSVLFIIDAIVSVAAAFIFKSASAFVWGLIASAIVEVVLSYALISLKPKFEWEIKKIKHVIHRGFWVNLTGIFSYLADNGDNIAVGKILGATSLGIYQVAFKFSILPITEIANVVNQVLFPVLSKFPDDDKPRLKRAFIKVVVANTIGAITLGVPVIVFAGLIIHIAMGDQWSSAIPVVRILAVYGIIRTMFGSFAALFLSVSKQEYVARMLFTRLAGLLISIVPLVSLFGMVGAAYAMLISSVVEIPVIIYYTMKVFSAKTK